MTSSTHHYARFIPSEEIDAQTVRHWQFGDVQHAAPGADFCTSPNCQWRTDWASISSLGMKRA